MRFVVLAMMLVMTLVSSAEAAPKPNPYVVTPVARVRAAPAAPSPRVALVDKAKAIIEASPRRRDNPYVVTVPKAPRPRP